MGEILSVDVLSSGCHKEQALRPLLLPHGVGTRWLEVSCDLPEIETVSPRGVLPDKLATLCKAAENTIQWRAEVLGKSILRRCKTHSRWLMDIIGQQLYRDRL